MHYSGGAGARWKPPQGFHSSLACVSRGRLCAAVWIAAGFLVHYDYQSRRALTEQRMLESARALTMVVDRELSNMQASLSVLATSKTLASGDLPAFYRRARAVIEAYPGAYILLADATGQEFLNTIAPFGAPLPKYSVPDAVRQVYATGRPVTTNAFKGAFTGRLMISVHVPVLRDGRVVYDLAMNVPPDPFAAVLFQQHLPPEWIGRIFDGNQVVIARNRFGEQFVGYQAVTVLRQTDEGYRGGYGRGYQPRKMSGCLTASADRLPPAGRWWSGCPKRS